MPDAVLYARVSTERQADRGYSQADQVARAYAYATRRGLRITAEFIEAESASRVGRKAFAAMLRALREQPAGQRRIVVEDISRLSRNQRDYLAVLDLSPEIHLLREDRVISTESSASDLLAADINIAIASHFSRQLSAKVKDGMRAKAQLGEFPTHAPFGYRNVTGANGRQNIAPHPTEAESVQWLFAAYESGNHSLHSLSAAAYAQGIVSPRSRRALSISQLGHILHRETYLGQFWWHGTLYEGTYEPLITPATFYAVQRLLEERNNGKATHLDPKGAFSGLLTCRGCGCALSTYKVRKKSGLLFTYYHCTGKRGNCKEPYLREETLSQAFAEAIDQLHFEGEALTAIRRELKVGHGLHQKTREKRRGELTQQERAHQRRLDLLLTHLVDERITPAEFERHAAAERSALAICAQERIELSADDRTYFEEVATLLQLLEEMPTLFRAQPVAEQRILLESMIESGTWGKGSLALRWRTPWDVCASQAIAVHADAASGSNFRKMGT